MRSSKLNPGAISFITFAAIVVVTTGACLSERSGREEAILENPGPLTEATAPEVLALFAKDLPTADRIFLTRPAGDIVGICAHIPLRSVGNDADQGFFALTRNDGVIHSIEPTSDPRLCG